MDPTLRTKRQKLKRKAIRAGLPSDAYFPEKRGTDGQETPSPYKGQGFAVNAPEKRWEDQLERQAIAHGWAPAATPEILQAVFRRQAKTAIDPGSTDKAASIAARCVVSMVGQVMTQESRDAGISDGTGDTYIGSVQQQFNSLNASDPRYLEWLNEQGLKSGGITALVGEDEFPEQILGPGAHPAIEQDCQEDD
jgi:hypothetical protein